MVELKKVDVSVERRVLGNLVMSTRLLSAVHSFADPSLFESSLSRIVGGWIWDYYKRTGEAPCEAISDIYVQNCGELKEADAQMVHEYLSTCSDQWKPTNESYAEAMALKYFRRRSVIKLSEELSRIANGDDPSVAESLVAEYCKPEKRESQGVSLVNDTGKIANAFDTEEESVFSFPNELGYVIGNFIVEDFAVFIAPPKRGKTWWLISAAVNAFLQGKNVLFVTLEMSEKQMIRRFWQYVSGCSRYGESVNLPYFEQSGQDHWVICDEQYDTEKVDTSGSAIKKLQKKLKSLSRGSDIQMLNFPTDSFSVGDLRAELKKLEVYNNFVPEVIVLDYADIMRHTNGKDERDRINGTYKGLRGLTKERQCVLLTASQTGRETIGGVKDASDKNVSEDMRKIAHCTKMITINQTEKEQGRGIYRISCTTQREGAVVHDQVVCTNCLAIGRAFVDTRLLSTIDTISESGAEDVAQSKFRRRR